jgi:putative membrane protein
MFLSNAYPWFKGIHIIAVISWMAGQLYLPRLFVNHAGLAAGSGASEMLKRMEGKLLKFIMRPAALLVFIFGGALASTPGLVDWTMGWIWVKLAGVIGLAVMHGLMERWRMDFAHDANKHSARFFRMANEVPTILMIVIVLMVAAKPF